MACKVCRSWVFKSLCFYAPCRIVEVLQDPDVVIYILAERRSLLEGWLQDCKATTVVGTPISVNITFAIETAAKRCAIEGKLLLWVCCLGRVRKVNETTVSDFMPMDGWEKAISGEDLKRLTSQMHSTCVLTVVLEVCNSGNFMGLPYGFADNGALVIHQPVEAAVLNGPRMICISACRNDEYAHFGNYRGLQCGAFTLILRGEIDKRRHGRPAVYIREIGHVAAPVLGKQHPVVAVSHPIDQDTLLGFPDFN
ncbi:hypothetical protein FRB93_007073 [Tulasnella sp. JGI-2019a]|nr:hypothetical protein FRB93_007073 [Tulasnella sp. JGI-2019a]